MSQLWTATGFFFFHITPQANQDFADEWYKS